MKNKINQLYILIFIVLISCDDPAMVNTSYVDNHVIFTSRRWWNYDIFITDENGQKITHLTKNRWLDFNPIITSDGSNVAFISDRDGNREIYTFELRWVDGHNQWQTHNLKNITNSPEHDWFPVFSPLDDKIVYGVYFPENDNYDIFQMDIDGSNKINLTNTPYYEKYPQFSPDGTFIIYQGWIRGKKEIFFTNLLDKNIVNLTNNSGYNDILSNKNSFSPDGRYIVFTSERDGNKEIYIMESDGSDQRRLTFNESDDYDPIFSSSGDIIIFTSERDNNKEIYTMSNDGTNILNISNNISDDWDAHIFKESDKIVFQSLREDVSNWEIYTMELNGANQKNISNNERTDYSFSLMNYSFK